MMVAYAYAAQCPAEILKRAVLDVPVPGTRIWDEAKARADPQIWHFGVQQRDIADMPIAGKEHASILDFYKKRTHVAPSNADIAVYADAYAEPGALRAGFELYRALGESPAHHPIRHSNTYPPGHSNASLPHPRHTAVTSEV
ncbi:hypothetical protein [Burkholderia cenocepacia]|uniref:hypothetical protein n=1 Tax=Burkholderia cenocepacia TaxID=95486 RepID=UPI001F4A05FB|nr:hypothetical protein [Burkholderia cenocepacia]